jgi:signal transduction histidine kinase
MDYTARPSTIMHQMPLMLRRPSDICWQPVVECLAGGISLALITLVCFRYQRQALTPTCLYLIVVLLVSLRGSLFSSIIVSFIAVLCLDYFFVPPLFSFRVSNESDVVAFITFVASSAVVTRLVSRVGKLLREKLEQSEAYLSEAQQLSHLGSFAWQVSSGELSWSEETFRIFDYDPTRKPTLRLVLQRTHPEDADLVERTFERASQDGRDFNCGHRLLMPDGSVKHLHIVAHAKEKKAGKLEFIGFVMDITAGKLAEEALRQAQAELAHVTRITTIGELTATIAHEVNQPLAAIVMNCNAGLRWLAAESPNLDEAREALHRTLRDGNRAGEIIARIRALLRKADIAKEALDINEAIREVIIMTRSEMNRVRVTWQLKLAPDLPRVLGDRVQLQQVLLNLILNGIEAMSAVEDRSRDLIVKTRVNGETEVLVTVCDSGVGFDPASMEKMFRAFHTTKPDGLGMGLSISRSIVESHSGRLWANLNDGPGATFLFSLLAHLENKSPTAPRGNANRCRFSYGV